MNGAAPITLLLLRDCPAARIVDLRHTLAPFDTIAAAFWIERVFARFLAETVHVVVVDPGVGSGRHVARWS
jgi:S-adenosylmethionine hydrolase